MMQFTLIYKNLICVPYRESQEETLKKFGQRLFEAELEGIVTVKDGRIYLSPSFA